MPTHDFGIYHLESVVLVLPTQLYPLVQRVPRVIEILINEDKPAAIPDHPRDFSERSFEVDPVVHGVDRPQRIY
jgi:hypothetical protein